MSNKLAGPQLNRRNFLKAGAALGATDFAPSAFIRIDRRGVVALVMPQVEMGQGIYIAQAILIAEELDGGLNDVKIEHVLRKAGDRCGYRPPAREDCHQQSHCRRRLRRRPEVDGVAHAVKIAKQVKTGWRSPDGSAR